MTQSEFSKLPSGTIVYWKDSTGKVVAKGIVHLVNRHQWISWDDGQVTEADDLEALRSVTL